MKKRLFAAIGIYVIFQISLFCQTSASKANRNTALRCLKLAENCLIGGDWNNAFMQSELGLSYDDSISDLIYVKAASSINLGKNRSEVLEIIREAFKKNNWLGYSLNGARILYSDLLCDTGDYEASLKLLDEEPFILSADAEFIRIKNYYRMGTKASIKDARLKVNTARRIYPNDSRFPTIFFNFEYSFMSEAFRTGLHYESDENVKTIAAAYLAKLPDYKDLDNEVELFASFFADDKEKLRLLKAIDAKKSRPHPLMAIAALENGLYSDSKAFDLFFNSFDEADIIPSEMLLDFALRLSDPEVKLKLAEKLTTFSHSLSCDLNLDLQNELIVKYENGRPAEIYYDKNMDGINELEALCDYGAPLHVTYPLEAISLDYSAYPEVSKVSFREDENLRSFLFLHQDYLHKPLEFVADPVLSMLGIDFYIPQLVQDLALPDSALIVEAASGVELPNTEFSDSRVLYSAEKGKLYYANFYQGDVRYAYADFSAGIPFLRHVDSDRDGFFETTEEYAAITEDLTEGFSLEKQALEIERIFGRAAIPSKLYLRKIQLDQNANTFYEYSEQFYPFNGKMCSWDNDDNGINDFFYIRSPRREGQPLEEAYIFADSENPAVTINFIDGIPVKLLLYDAEEMIYAGKADHFYWVSEEGSEDDEKALLKAANGIKEQGLVSITQSDDKRFSLIKVNGNVFARILPDSYLLEDEDEE